MLASPSFVFGSKYLAQVLPLISEAKVSIKILIFYWQFDTIHGKSPVARFTNALVQACQRGVIIQVLCESEEIARRLRLLGFKAKNLYSDRLLHAKVMLFDDSLVCIGSHNFTKNAFSSNLEVSLIVDLGSKENALVDYFKNLWPL